MQNKCSNNPDKIAAWKSASYVRVRREESRTRRTRASHCLRVPVTSGDCRCSHPSIPAGSDLKIAARAAWTDPITSDATSPSPDIA